MVWRLHYILITGLSCLCIVWPAAANPSTQPADLYAQPNLRTIHIRLSGEAWKQMQPSQRPRFEPRRPAATQPAAQEPAQRIVRSPFGYGYAPATGILELDDEPGVEMAVRFKGNLSYSLSASAPRRPFKIEFDHADPARRFHGLATLNLNNSASDLSMLREPLAYATFRDAGVVAPRTSFALVYLTVAGRYDREYLGLYTLVEQVDREFLRRRFGDGSGMLLKPEMVRGLPYLGGDWAHYAERYNPKGQDNGTGSATFIDMLRLVHFGDDATFRQKIASFIAIDQFLRFIAVQAMIVNFDSFLTTGHNYYLYHNPGDGRFHWIPWDLDLSFGAFVMVAAPPQQTALSVFSPHVPPNRLIERILSIEEFRQAYDRHLRELAAGVFSAEKLHERLESMRQHLQRAGEAAQAANRYGSPTTRPAGLGGVPALDRFLAGRLDSVAEQLAGQGKAFVPAHRTGLQLTATWAEHRRDALMQSATRALRDALALPASAPIAREGLLAAAQRWIAEPGITQRALAERLASLLPVPENFMFEPGPGIEWAAIILHHADANGDGRLTPEELSAAAASAFDRADANKDGAVSDAETRRALLRLASRP